MEKDDKDLQLEVERSAVEVKQSEEEMQDVTELFEDPAPLTREEILAGSREENKYGDERTMQWRLKAGTFAFSSGLLLAGIVVLVYALTSGRVPVEMMFVVCGMQAVQGIIIGIKCSGKIKKVYMAQGVVFAVLTAAFLALWILQLCGVM